MMTSVTLPSTSGPIHGGYSAVGEETTSSEPDFETPRPIKRCLTAPLADTFKKRRKQATPVRISAAETDPVVPEGKLLVPSPEPDLQCPVCQLFFTNVEQLQNHVSSEHGTFECKREPEDFPPIQPACERSETPLELTTSRNELPWMSDLQNKEWMNATGLHGLPFSPANSMFMAMPPFSQPDSIPNRQPIRIFNPDAYCELCNKEFCNKYFLKTHKANKHGIYSDPPATETSNTPVNIPSYTASLKLSTSVPSVDTTPPVKSENKPQINMITPFGDIFPSPFPNKFFQKFNKTNVGLYDGENPESSAPASNSSNGEIERNIQEESTVDESSSPRNLQNEMTVSEQEGIYYTSPSKMSPGQQSRELDLSNRLRRIGVMNPKAFCEICCKEYCNKYFLRTHKMKRHGIYIPDDRDKDIKMETAGNTTFWSHNTQTSPLNLIMTEQTTGGDRKTTSPADVSCDICGIKFQNASLARLHSASVHSGIPLREHEHPDGNPDDTTKRNVEPPPSSISEKSMSADAISEDLQKLQTMILQLNDLDVNRVNGTCTSCNKEFENRYYLHAHMMTEHGLLLDDVGDVEKSAEVENNINNNTMCDLCGKDVQNMDEMKKHMSEYHHGHQTTSIGEVKKEDYNGFTTPEKSVGRTTTTTVQSGQISERRASMSLTPTSSYCEICNKELCNKYFMKTHMQRMHGIEIENGAQIGGVICDICNKELCSKYFLRVHKHNTHGIVEYGASLLQPRKNDGENTPLQHIPSEPDPALKPADLADLSHRYFTHFTEVCTICSRRFRSTKWLKAHLLSDHGQAGAEKWAELEQHLQQTMGQYSKITATAKTLSSSSQNERSSPTLKIPNGGGQENQPQQKVGIQNVLSSIFGNDETNVKTYNCSYCPFSTPLLPLLFVHERSHSIHGGDGENVTLKCPVCTQTFLQPELLQHHMFTQHPFLPLPPFFNGNVENQGDVSKEPSETTEEESTNKNDDGNVSNVSDLNRQQQQQQQQLKNKKLKRKLNRLELSPEVGQSLKDVAKRSQLPATYALPQVGEETAVTVVASSMATAGGISTSSSPPNNLPGSGGYVMQAFLLEESVAAAPIASTAERRIMPSVVFLPVFQKQPAPITVTFTLTPA